MPNPLEDKEFSKRFSEVCEVVRTAVIVKREKLYRLEVEKRYSSPNTPYTVSCWVEEDVILQPSSGGKGGKPKSMRVWKSCPLGQVVADNTDDALRQALAFLTEQKY